MDLQTQDNQEINSQSSPATEEGGAAAAPPPAALEAAPAEKTGLDKLKEKALSGIAPAAKPEVDVAAQAAAALAVYKPNFKYKAAGKEMEVPKLLQGVIKDAESEKYLHTLLSKAHGIEMIQEKLRGTREQRDQAAQAYHQVMQPIQFAQEAYKRGDLDSVFDVMKVDRNKVLQWAYRQVELSQMPPDQRQVHERASQAEKRAWELERQTQQAAQQGQTQQAEQINQMLDLVMERQDVSALAQAYDTKKGKEGSFRDLVVLMGEQAYSQGRMISPMEAAKNAAELLGEKWGAPQAAAVQAAAPQAAAQMQAQPAAQAEKSKIVLPNVASSKTASPGKGKVKSIDDIRKMHQKMATQ